MSTALTATTAPVTSTVTAPETVTATTRTAATTTTTSTVSASSSSSFCGRIVTVLSKTQVALWNFLVKLIGRSDLQYAKAQLDTKMVVIQNADASDAEVIAAFKAIYNLTSDKTLTDASIKDATNAAMARAPEGFRESVYYNVFLKETAIFEALNDQEQAEYLAALETPDSDNFGGRTFTANPRKDVCQAAVSTVFAAMAAAAATATSTTTATATETTTATSTRTATV